MIDSKDYTKFYGLVVSGLQAFETDVSYAIAVSKAATAIEQKREAWKRRALLKEQAQEKENAKRSE